MKYIRQFFIILFFSFLGEGLHAVLPIQIPASIYGLVLLFIALMAGWVRLEQVDGAAKLLISVMPIMFIPAGVALLESWEALMPILIPVCSIMVVSTVLVMGISGRVTQYVMKRRRPKKDE